MNAAKRIRIFGQNGKRGRDVDFDYDPESKLQNSVWHTKETPRSKKSKKEHIAEQDDARWSRAGQRE